MKSIKGGEFAISIHPLVLALCFVSDLTTTSAMDAISLIGVQYVSNSITTQGIIKDRMDLFKVSRSAKQCGFLVVGQIHCS